MQRSKLQAVTESFPVLLPTDAKTDMIAYLEPVRTPTPKHLPLGTLTIETRPVRIVTDEEVSKARREDKGLALGIKLMRTAEAHNDRLAAETAYTLLFPFLFGVPVPHQRQAYTAFSRMRASAAEARPEVRYAVSTAPMITHALANARLVAWQRGGGAEQGIGIYCPDLRTAIAAQGLLGKIRLCQHCHKVFLPHQSSQFCCSVKCREAHRIARWRARKKAKAGVSSRKGGA